MRQLTDSHAVGRCWERGSASPVPVPQEALQGGDHGLGYRTLVSALHHVVFPWT